MKVRRKRAALLSLAMLAGIVAFTGLWLRSYERQVALNRQLVAALVKTDDDSWRKESHYDSETLALVNAGADPNAPYQPPHSPSFRQMLRNLFYRSAPPNPNSFSAFMLVCGDWRDEGGTRPGTGPDAPQLVQAMLEHGANVNERDEDGWTPLIWASYRGLPQTVAVLLQHGADINAKSSSGTTPLREACRISSPQCVRVLLQRGADVNAQDQEGTSALMLAVEFSEKPGDTWAAIVSQLLSYGANPELPDKANYTSLQFAEEGKRDDLIALFRRAQAKK